MLDGLLKPKFHSKCKSYARLTKTRLDTIRKKRNAVQKFLREDIADLLTSALDYNAYGRVEGLLVEQNMSSCYELIAKYIGCILDHVKDLSKQRDCPDECKEAIPSLMYAAARFSDLPELRDLRTLFTEKFGNSLEPYLSKEFVKRLRQDPPTKEMKIQLLRDLAQEFSILWNSKALEQRLYSPPALHELQGKAKYDPLNDCDDKKRQKNNERDTQSQGRKGVMGGASWRLQSSSDDETSTDNSSPDGPKACSSSLGSVSEDEVEIKGPFSNRLVPPPYVKEKFNEAESNLKKATAGSEAAPVKESKPKPRSVRRRPRNPPPGYYDAVSHSKADDTNAKVDSNGMKSEKANDEEEERVMDGLLMHYSKKQSLYESGTGKGYPWKQVECDDEQQNIRRTKSGSGVSPVPVGGTSLPPKDKTTHPMGTLKGRGAASLHVHPSLPDYDDLSARLAALRGT